jgi:hypothetical protein
LNKSIAMLWLSTGTVLQNLNISVDGSKGDGKTMQNIPRAKPVSRKR